MVCLSLHMSHKAEIKTTIIIFSFLLFSLSGEQIVIKLSKGIAGFVARSAQMVNIADCYQDARFDQYMDRKTGYHTKSMANRPQTYRTLDTHGPVPYG